MRILNKATWPCKVAWKTEISSERDERLTWAWEQFGQCQVSQTEHHIYFKHSQDLLFYTLKWQ